MGGGEEKRKYFAAQRKGFFPLSRLETKWAGQSGGKYGKPEEEGGKAPTVVVVVH